ncbi:MAG: FIST C-terminal domain-containing protein [Synergistaceae bacterium]|jgi:hypothetical protein|nr:FIST C-terminal domain-containing protein [Synergistaceae bacterium]
MLNFRSASVRIADSSRAIDECLDILYGGETPDSRALWIVNAAMGHKLAKIAEAIHARVPGASVLGSSCGGVVGREGMGEALTHIAVMVVSGPENELGWAAVDGFSDGNSLEKGLELAKKLQEKIPSPKIIYLLSRGLCSCNDDLLSAFGQVFGNPMIFGGLSSDNYKALTTSQYIGDKADITGIWAVGFADPTLKAAARATHGFKPYGVPMTVTKANHNEIIEFDGLPALTAYRRHLGDITTDEMKKILIHGGLATKLPDNLAEDYGSDYILRSAAPSKDDSQNMRTTVTIREGQQWYITGRDEGLIFMEQQKALTKLQEDIKKNSPDGQGHPVAVFQTDCLLRGRTLFNKIRKEEIIAMMQNAFLNDAGEVPPWLGMYGFGEFCPLAGENVFHTYTTSLLVLYR